MVTRSNSTRATKVEAKEDRQNVLRPILQYDCHDDDFEDGNDENDVA